MPLAKSQTSLSDIAAPAAESGNPVAAVSSASSRAAKARAPESARKKAKKKPASGPAGANSTADRLRRLGLRTDMDFVLHLPLRYEDETSIASIREAGFLMGRPAQVEGVVTSCDIQFRPRRQWKTSPARW
jgi:hypothetical protein